MWPIFAWLILIAAITSAFVFTRRIERLIGILPPRADSTTAVVSPVASADSLPQVSVIPQGEPDDSIAQISAKGGGAAASKPATDQPNAGKPAPLNTSPAATNATSASTQSTQAPPHNDSASATHSMLRHPWLRANGDSGTARAADEGIAPDELRRMQLEELQGHLALVRRFAARGDVAHARAAYRDATDEARGLELTDRSLSQRLKLLLSFAQRDAMQACQSAHADTLNPFGSQVDCGTLFAW